MKQCSVELWSGATTCTNQVKVKEVRAFRRKVHSAVEHGRKGQVLALSRVKRPQTDVAVPQ